MPVELRLGADWPVPGSRFVGESEKSGASARSFPARSPPTNREPGTG